MAALQLLTRLKPLTIILPDLSQLKSFNNSVLNVVQIHKRWGTFQSSPMYQDPSQYTDYEVTKDPQEWKYVERLLKSKTIPLPSFENKDYSSGWRPPTSKPGDYSYYIQRTRNYMQPVYLHNSFRGMRKVTIVRRIHGNIWTLKSELKEHIERNVNKPIGVRVNELTGQIQFRGDYVTLVKRWLDAKGF